MKRMVRTPIMHTYNGCVKSGISEQLEIHDSRPTTSRWHLMMMTCRWFFYKKKKQKKNMLPGVMHQIKARNFSLFYNG